MKKAVGLDLGGTFIKVGLVNEKGKILRKTIILTKGEEGKDIVLQQMRKAIDFAIKGVGKKKICGIGIGTPGLVDDKGCVYEAPNIVGWDNINLKRIFEKKYKVPVVVENDANSIAWGEYVYGAGKGCNTMICVTLGTGVGGGVVIDGKLLRGCKYSAAEIGHMTIDYRGPECNCGSLGCIESFVGRKYLVRFAIKAMQKGEKTLIHNLVEGNLRKITPEIISEAYHKGDKLAKGVWIDAGVRIGAMFAGLVNLFNPDRIVIGGGISKVKGILFKTIKETIKERAMKKLSEDVNVVPAALGDDTGIISCAALVFKGNKL